MELILHHLGYRFCRSTVVNRFEATNIDAVHESFWNIFDLFFSDMKQYPSVLNVWHYSKSLDPIQQSHIQIDGYVHRWISLFLNLLKNTSQWHAEIKKRSRIDLSMHHAFGVLRWLGLPAFQRHQNLRQPMHIRSIRFFFYKDVRRLRYPLVLVTWNGIFQYLSHYTAMISWFRLPSRMSGRENNW